MKKFIPAPSNSKKNVINKDEVIIESLSGNEAMDFYLNTLSRSSLKKNKTENEVKITPNKNKSNRSQTFNDRQINQFLLAAQWNNVQLLKEMLCSYQYILDCKDSFGWTALMCAVQSNSIEAIKFLVANKADISSQDAKGRTAISLARNDSVVEILKRKPHLQGHKVNETTNSNLVYCKTCNEHYRSNESKIHNSSIVHMMSLNKTSARTWYGIPDGNKGFQLLLKTGWNREKGLGPSGTGHKFPVKTSLKNDRSGVGAKNLPSKITHFSPHDRTAVDRRKESERFKNKKKILSSAAKEKQFERCIRLQFS